MTIEKLTTLSYYDVTGRVEVVPMERVHDWCKLPYINHPKGCPNFGKKATCPPMARALEDIYDLKRQHWFMVAEFDIGEWAQHLKEEYPRWNERQCRNIYYWQNGVYRILKAYVHRMRQGLINTDYTLVPEAHGVNLIVTLRKLGVPIKTKPEDAIYKVAFVGYKREGGHGYF